MNTLLLNAFVDVWNDFYKCFISYDMWKMYLQGLRNTLFIAAGACLLGLLIGIVVTCIRVAPKNNPFMKILYAVCQLYVTVIRGTHVLLQLFICYFVLLTSIRNMNFLGIKDTSGIWVAIITFGVNSGAYMSEILRGGINSVEQGQMEAGRSLGLNWLQTFTIIILPQALKNAIPSMFNEFITLIKETSVAGYVGIVDLTKIQSYVTTQTMELFMPLIIIATIYLVLVLGLQQIQEYLERRLAKSDKK